MAETSTCYYVQHTGAGDGAAGSAHYRIRKIIWHSYTTANHTLQVKNGTGTIVIPAFVAGATSGVPIVLEFEKKPLDLIGLETDVLGSGTVIYLLA